MAIGDTRLPEGTDSIIGGASVRTDLSSTGGLSSTVPGFDETPSASIAKQDPIADAKAKVGDKAAELRGQAADKARGLAVQGKDRAVEGLDSVQRLIGEAADTIDAKVGAQYGAYIRQAGDSVSAFSDRLRGKDVEELLADARDLVRKSPAIAIGAATAAGFLLARITKAGLDATTRDDAPTMGGVTPVAPVVPVVPASTPGSRPIA